MPDVKNGSHLVEDHDAPRRASTASSTSKLASQWPTRLILAASTLTVATIGWSAFEAGGDWSVAALACGPVYLVGAVVLLWLQTLLSLRRWRSTVLEAYGRMAGHCEDLGTEIERHKLARLETDRLLKSHEQTIRELRDTTEQAVAAEREARARDRAKSEYLARMSGEIRTPLTTMLGFTTTLLDEGDLSKAPPERVEALYTIKQKGEQLLDTIDDTLELCEIELRGHQVNPCSCSLVEIVDEVYRLMVGWAHARGLKLLVDYESQVPESINTDPERLSQILINLLGNAVKFTLSGDVRMRISLLQDDATNPRLCFEVIDSGIGMHKNQAGRLFGGFASATFKEGHHPRSSGLGLTISKRYAEALGGDLVLIDTLPGIGTRLRLTIQVGSLEGVKMVRPPSPLTVQPSPTTPSGNAPKADVLKEAGKSEAELTNAAAISTGD